MTAPVVTALDIAQVTIPSLSLLHTLIFFVPSAVRILFHIRLRKMTRLHLLQLTITFSILIIQLLYTFETSCHLAIVLESFSFLNFRDNGRLLDPISALGVMTLYVIALCSLVKYIIIKYESLVPPPNANIVIEHNRLCAVFKPSNVGHITLAIAVITGCMVVVAFGMSSFVSISSENLVAKIARVFSTIAFNGFCGKSSIIFRLHLISKNFKQLP